MAFPQIKKKTKVNLLPGQNPMDLKMPVVQLLQL